MNRQLLLSIFCLCFIEASPAQEFDVTPDDYRAVLQQLQPGDTLRLAPGIYRRGLPLHHLSGNPDHPITITGAGPGRAVFMARFGHNTVSLLDVAFLVLKNFTLEGLDLPVDAVKCEGHAEFAHHITLENLSIHGHGHNQQTVGISTKCPAWNWVIRNNVIEEAGTGLYLGNSDGRAPFVAGLIENNLVVDSIGYNLQIKHQQSRPELPGMPTEPSETLIRHNVFLKTAPLREGAQPRPSVLVGHWPREGPGAEDRYLIYGNFFYGNPAESLFQGEGNLALYGNVFVSPDQDAIRIQPHNDIPKRITVAYNTILAHGAGISFLPGPGSEWFEQRFIHNAIFAATPLSGSDQGENAAGSLAQAGSYLAAPYAALEGLDLRPLQGKLRLRKAMSLPTGLTGLQWDFDGHKRDMRVAGAYSEWKGPLRWQPKRERMPFHD